MKSGVTGLFIWVSAFLLIWLVSQVGALLGDAAPAVLLSALTALLLLWTRRYVTQEKRRREVERATKPGSPEVAALVRELHGAYPPYVIEAAQALGKAQDRTAVPALIHVLEQAAENQRPGWRDVAASLADALGEIGDGRALETLYRLENVRGIGFIPNIRHAIAVIEPQAVLLRASSESESVQSALLLRPSRNAGGESDKGLLLRAAEAETH